MGGPSSTQHRRTRKGLLALFVGLVVVAEIAFLGRLGMAKNAFMVRHWTSSFPFLSAVDSTAAGVSSPPPVLREPLDDDRRWEVWLETEDAVAYSRDFRTDPIVVASAEEKDWTSCSVGCKFGSGANKVPDATFNLRRHPVTASVLRSMESSHYYPQNNIDVARWWAQSHQSKKPDGFMLPIIPNVGLMRGYNIIMTTSLSSDVPVGYFSWVEYDIMAPMHPKSEDALAAAFISNCGAKNFRLRALESLEKLGIKIDSYVDKVKTLKRYKFSLAFENSNEEDYVTEKFFQSLVAGTVPIVVGAPNIQDFAPSSGSVLHIKELNDVVSVAKTMKYLASNPDAYNKSVSWKYDGPSDFFKALVDMAAVHSSCRLCIHLATNIQEKEEMTSKFQKRPCKCISSKGTVYHVYVRERGRFELESIYLRSSNLTLKALESAVFYKFKSLNHTPIWKHERPKSIRGDDNLKIYKIYPVGLTQRQALYSFKFDSDADLRKRIENNPCAKFEVIFV